MSSLVDALLLPEHAEAIIGFLTLFELRRLLLLGRSASTEPCRVAFEKRASQVYLYICDNDSEDEDSSPAPQRFSPFTGTWEVLPSPQLRRRSANLVELDGILYVGSGHCFDDDGKLIKFDPRHGYWQDMPPFLTPRVGYGLLAVAGRLFVMGGRHEGFDDDENFLAPPDAGEYFDIASGLWYFLRMSAVQPTSGLVAPDGDMIYVCATVFQELHDVERNLAGDFIGCLNAQTLQWESIDQPAFCKEFADAPHMAMLEASCSSVYLGSDKFIGRYDAKTHQWQVLPPMPEELRHIDSSEHASRGCLFICGGVNTASELASSFGMFDRMSSCWQLLPPLLKPCASPALLSFGSHIYILGGEHTGSPGKASIRFCLLRRSWEVLDDLVEPVSLPVGVVSIGFQDTAKYASRPPCMFSNEQLAASVAASTYAGNTQSDFASVA